MVIREPRLRLTQAEDPRFETLDSENIMPLKTLQIQQSCKLSFEFFHLIKIVSLVWHSMVWQRATGGSGKWYLAAAHPVTLCSLEVALTTSSNKKERWKSKLLWSPLTNFMNPPTAKSEGNKLAKRTKRSWCCQNHFVGRMSCRTVGLWAESKSDG